MGCWNGRIDPHCRAQGRRRRGQPLALALILGLVAACTSSGAPATGTSASRSSSSVAPTTPTPITGTPGAAGVGDPYFADLGNGGYDVQHYDIALRVDVVGQQIAGTTTITANATQALSRFDLDLVGLNVSGVRVDGSSAQVTRDGRELEITPAAPIADGATFTTAVDYAGTPGVQSVPGAGNLREGWIWDAEGGSYVLAEPDGASTWFPGNDHPTDKATFTFAVTAPDDLQVAANGTLSSHDGSTWTYDETDPMATYLATVVVGHLSFTDDAGPDGIQLRNAFTTDVAASAAHTFVVQGDMISYLETLFGPFPFKVYGAVLAPGLGGAAMECQTLSLFDAHDYSDDVIVHELAHQWFGDSVSVARWQDIWLNEGFATYAEWLWSEHEGRASAADIARQQAARHWDPPGAPGADRLFDQFVYARGALTLQALREAIGDDAFFTTLRTYASQRRFGLATTADFEATAEQVSGQDLRDLFQSWLYADAMPSLG